MVKENIFYHKIIMFPEFGNMVKENDLLNKKKNKNNKLTTIKIFINLFIYFCLYTLL